MSSSIRYNPLIPQNLDLVGTGSGGTGVLQLTPDSGGAVTPVANNINLFGIGGLDTVADGPATMHLNNKRWLSQYVVDPSAVPGSNAEYTTIQSAINALNASGVPGTVIIRAGTYTENLTLFPNTQLLGVAIDGRIQTANPVIIIGSHTFLGDSTAPGSNAILIENIFFQSTVDAFSLTNNGPNGSFFAFKFCTVNSSLGRAFVLATTPGAGGMQCILVSSEGRAELDGVDVGDNCALQMDQSASISSNTANGINLTGTASSCSLHFSDINGQTNAVNLATATSAGNSESCEFFSNTTATINFAGAGSFDSLHSTHNGNGGGDYISGAAGTYSYADEIITGSASTIAPGITQGIRSWRPFGTTGNSSTAVRGTSAFDSNNFTSTNGFITWTSSLPITSVNTAASPYTVLTTDQFIAVDSSGGAVTILLPNAPATGRIFTIKDSTGSAAINNITVTTVGGVVNIDGFPTFAITFNYQSITVIFDGTAYEVF